MNVLRLSVPSWGALGLALISTGALTAITREPRIELRYALSPDSFHHDGVPRGQISRFEWSDSKVYPGTVRRYYVYVPAQYDAKKPAALMVFQDGHAYLNEDGDFRVPTVFDNLIHKKEIPVMIAVFVDPGHKGSALPAKPGWTPAPENRSVEYDTLSGDYAKFLVDEILPAVAKDHPFTRDPDGHAICGMSSGGICAFTVAWQRPDQFRKVLSHIGSFTNIRGGDAYPGMIRRDRDKKPLRVFLQDGSNDLDNDFGNWPLANQQMFAALTFRKYDVKFDYGQGAHNGNHGGAILPDSLRWLWRDYKLPDK
jgi:enterochelin esterase family protein